MGPVGAFAEWATANPYRLAGVSIAVGVAAVGGFLAVQAAIAYAETLGTYEAVTNMVAMVGGGGSTAYATNMYAQLVYQAALKNTANQTALIELAKMEQMKGAQIFKPPKL